MELDEPNLIRIGDMELDMERGRLSKGKRSSHLGPVKFKLMKVFGQYPNRVLSEERLRWLLYGEDYRGEAAIRANIRGCRLVLLHLQSKARINVIVHYGWEFVPPTG